MANIIYTQNMSEERTISGKTVLMNKIHQDVFENGDIVGSDRYTFTCNGKFVGDVLVIEKNDKVIRRSYKAGEELLAAFA